PFVVEEVKFPEIACFDPNRARSMQSRWLVTARSSRPSNGFKLRKLVTFHQRIAAAREFVDPGAETSLPALLETLRLCPKDLWSGNVNGDMSAGRGGQLLHEFASPDSVAAIVNVRYLTEASTFHPSIRSCSLTHASHRSPSCKRSGARSVAPGSSRLEPPW